MAPRPDEVTHHDAPVIWQEPAKGGYPDRSFLGLPGIERMGAGRRGLIPHSPMS
jgi:hypothetical protein